MDPMLSDVDETIHSQSDTESDGDVDKNSDVADETIQQSKTGIYNTHHHPFLYFFMLLLLSRC